MSDDRPQEPSPPDELPHPDEAQAPESPAPDQPPAAAAEIPEPASDPVFWGFSDLFLFAGLAVPAMLAGFGLVRAVLLLFHIHPIRAAEALAEQFIGYLFLFLVLVVILRQPSVSSGRW